MGDKNIIEEGNIEADMEREIAESYDLPVDDLSDLVPKDDTAQQAPLAEKDQVNVSVTDEGDKPEAEGDAELSATEKKKLELEREAAKLKELHLTMDKELGTKRSAEDIAEIDARSVYVGNVDYGTSPEELQQYFQPCGSINRVTILTDKYSGQPKGFAYVEFVDKDSVANAMLLNETQVRNRAIKVTPKRTNVPGMSRGRGRGRGRGRFRGRGRGGGYRYHPYAPY